MFGDSKPDVLQVPRKPSAMASTMVGRSRIEIISLSRFCSTRCTPPTEICDGMVSVDQFLLRLAQIVEQLLCLGVRQQLGHVVLNQLG